MTLSELVDAETLGHCCRRPAKWQAIRLENWWKSAIRAVCSSAPVLDELCNKTRDDEQQNNMNAAALVQQDF